MTTTIEKKSPKPRIKVPAIREVCLVGSPTRRYWHLTQRTQDSGLRTERDSEGQELSDVSPVVA